MGQYSVALHSLEGVRGFIEHSFGLNTGFTTLGEYDTAQDAYDAVRGLCLSYAHPDDSVGSTVGHIYDGHRSIGDIVLVAPEPYQDWEVRNWEGGV